ncbi:ISXO2-like transposase domain [Popillia japonica]|uniref:ISXO2-like transposase domain n=1 Tax=Popillia japonica TaxID=7064 RepID=A0AAW1N4P8_POPJA
MKLPPHTTYVLQPLDVAVFKGLTTNWDKELCKWQRANPRKKIPKPEFVSLITNLTKALCKWQRANPRKKIPKPEFVSLITNLTKALPAAHIINGFKTTSIYDAEVNGVNKDIIPETIFKKADLEKYILPGSIVVSDGWRAYNNLHEIGGGMYEHQVVIHEENFVDPEDTDIHTQNVENMWLKAKGKLRRQFGTSENLFPSYLHQFIWRNKCRNMNTFCAFLVKMPNVQKKLSGYQYKRRRLEKEAQTQKQVGALKKYLQSTCSSTEINDNTAECPILNPGIKENTESPKIDEQQMEVISKPSGSGTIPLPNKRKHGIAKD